LSLTAREGGMTTIENPVTRQGRSEPTDLEIRNSGEGPDDGEKAPGLGAVS